MSRVLITGAAGFVAGGLGPHLRGRGVLVRCAVRTETALPFAWCDDLVVVGDLADGPRWGPALEGVDTVVHLAARVHRMGNTQPDALQRYREVNVDASAALARQAAEHGVRRLVFLSSIKVNGEQTEARPFTARDRPAPVDPYAVSKHEAEDALAEIGRETGLEVVTLRLPLVYGPGVGGNFRRLMALIWRGAPLPLGSIDNHRSMLGLTNLCELISVCLEHPQASGRVFLAADDESLSTPDLVRCIAAAMSRPARLVPVPPRLLQMAARVTGRSEEVARLCHSLEVDTSATRQLLDWAPSLSIGAGVEEAASWFRARYGAGPRD